MTCEKLYLKEKEKILYPDKKKQKMHEKSEHGKGFTQIPNKVITEILIKGLLSQTEMRIAFYIIRWSVGFHKKWTDKITVARIANDIDMKYPEAHRAVSSLKKRNILTVKDGMYKFNEHTVSWNITKSDSLVSQKVIQSITKSYNPPLTNINENKVNSHPKESIKEIINKIKRKTKERKTCTESISEITFNKQTFKFEDIPVEKLEKWKEAFPFVNVEVELKKMEAWLTANPKRLKKNYEKFIVNWLKRTKGGKNERYISLNRRTIEKGSEGKSYEPGKW